MTLQVFSVVLQGLVALMFAGSLLVASRNLALFRHNHQAMLLKSVMDEYRALVDEGVFESYPDELDTWRSSLGDSSLAPNMAYYTRFDSISRVGLFYDWVGLLVAKGTLDFDLCFEVVPMPYEFWKNTRDFRVVMKEATYAGFWDSFEHLHDRYQRRRATQRCRPSLRALLARPTGPSVAPAPLALVRPVDRLEDGSGRP